MKGKPFVVVAIVVAASVAVAVAAEAVAKRFKRGSNQWHKSHNYLINQSFDLKAKD